MQAFAGKRRQNQKQQGQPMEQITGKKERFIKIDEVERQTALSEATIYRKMKNKEFPTSVSIGANSKVWLESEIQDWIAEQVRKHRNQ